MDSKEIYSLKLRIMSGDDLAMGPGKADLLEEIQKTGSIAAAGRAMGMSYKRAWNLVEVMNKCFSEPLIEKSKGGASKGGAIVTPLGIKVIEHYRSLQNIASNAVEKEIASFLKLMKDHSSGK